MRFVSRIDVILPGDAIARAPSAWDRLKSLFGEVDLATGRVRDAIEAATFVYQYRAALDALGIDDGRSLVVDGVTVFHDARDAKGDLPDLVLALSEHVATFGGSARELRLAVEREEAGLRTVLEATVTTEHAEGAPSARVTVLGELAELDPKRGEGAEEYRARIEPFVSDPTRAAAVRLQFGAFVSRLETALARAFEETRFAVTTEAIDVPMVFDAARAAPARARDERPSAGPAVDTATPQRNFSISLEQRIAAFMTGPPPYAVRLRKIEDLESELVAALAERGASQTIPVRVARGLEELNRLIAEHNRYYPIECNLPMDVATGRLMELGEPWRPRAALTIDALRTKALAAPAR